MYGQLKSILKRLSSYAFSTNPTKHDYKNKKLCGRTFANDNFKIAFIWLYLLVLKFILGKQLFKIILKERKKGNK